MSTIVSVHSFRGGTGKSSITASLATIIALQGKRVAIIDADIQSPGIHALFGMTENNVQNSLNDYLWGKCTIEEAAYRVGDSLKMADGQTGLPQGELYLVPSSIKAHEIAKILEEGYQVDILTDGIETLIDLLDLDFLFIDTHPGLNNETLMSIVLSDVLLVVMRPDRQDYQGTAVMVNVARKLSVPDLYLVMNKVLEEYDSEALKTQVTQTYDTLVAGLLPFSEDMVRLSSEDVFSLRHPELAWTARISEVAETVMGCAENNLS